MTTTRTYTTAQLRALRAEPFDLVTYHAAGILLCEEAILDLEEAEDRYRGYGGSARARRAIAEIKTASDAREIVLDALR